MIHLTDWESIWRFLSLDDARGFFDELWLPFPASELQPALRDILASRCEQEFYHESYGIIHAELTGKFIDLCGHSGFRYLCRWVSDRFLDAGRRSEHQWWSLCHDLSRLTTQNDQDSVAVRELLVPLMKDVGVNEGRLERSLAEVFSGPEPEWDAKIRSVYDGLERSGSEALISLIARGNAFVCSWERWCGSLSDDQLRQLFWVGRSIASPAVAVDLALPGAWRAELSYFIEEAKLCEVPAHPVS